MVPDGKNPQAWNRYAYVYNNPINHIDPTGHKACDEQWGCNDEGKPRKTEVPPQDVRFPSSPPEVIPEGTIVGYMPGPQAFAPWVPMVATQWSTEQYRTFSPGQTMWLQLMLGDEFTPGSPLMSEVKSGVGSLLGEAASKLADGVPLPFDPIDIIDAIGATRDANFAAVYQMVVQENVAHNLADHDYRYRTSTMKVMTNIKAGLQMGEVIQYWVDENGTGPSGQSVFFEPLYFNSLQMLINSVQLDHPVD